MAKKKKKSAGGAKKKGRRVGGGRSPLNGGLIVGAAASPVAGVLLSRVSPVSVPAGYASLLGAAAVFLANKFAPRMVSREMVMGAVASAVGAAATRAGSTALGLSAPRFRPHGEMGYQVPVNSTLGYQVPVSRTINNVSPRRSAVTGTRRAF